MAYRDLDIRPDDDQPCSVCGCEERGQGGYLTCQCPAPLDPDWQREMRDERRRLAAEDRAYGVRDND